MYSKSNATDKIKPKLLRVHKSVFSWIFSHIDITHISITDQNALFKGLLPPPEGRGELVVDDDLYPIQGRLHCLLGLQS